jgi:hypothetical protein
LAADAARRPAGGVSATPEAGFTPARALEEASAAEDAEMKTLSPGVREARLLD